MKDIFKVSLTVFALTAIIVMLVSGVSAVSDIEYSDATGDVEYVGLEDSTLHDNIDITLLAMDTAGDPMVIELSTLAGITIEASGMDYYYYFYLDLTGDDLVDATITITEEDQYISGDTVSGTNSPITGVSGETTSTLRVELPLELFTSVPTVDDVSARSRIKDGGYWAEDHVNRDFMGDDAEIEITPPSDHEDPGETSPTNPSIGMSIDSFTMDITSTETTYEYTLEAIGSGSDDIVVAYYSIWAYGQGESGAQQTWEESEIDEEHSYGDHVYREEFLGTGPDGSWSTWKWYFHSAGPLDDNNRARFEDPGSYWGPLENMILYVRGYDAEGEWDQDFKDITKEYTGITPSKTIEDEDTKDEDSPGFGIPLMMAALFISAAFIYRRRR